MSFGHCWLYIISLAFLAFSISWHPTVKQNTFIWKYIWKGFRRTQSASVVLWEIFTFPACWKQLALFQLQSRLTMSCGLLFSSPFFSMHSNFFFIKKLASFTIVLSFNFAYVLNSLWLYLRTFQHLYANGWKRVHCISGAQ